MHHGHPVARHGDHSPPLIEPHQLGLLGEQHAGRGQFQARQDLLPQFAQVGFAPGSSVGCEGCFRAGLNGRGNRRDPALHCSALRCLGGYGLRHDWLGRSWDGPGRNGLGRRSSGCGLELGLCQEAQQQDLEPQPGIDAVAQLLLAALELGLPEQQPRFADTAGQLR